MKNSLQKLSLFGGGLFAALLASTCCLAPLLSVAALLGVSAAHITFLAGAKPYLMGLSLILTMIGLYRSHRSQANACCKPPADGARTSFSVSRSFVWLAAVVTVLILLWPYAANAGPPLAHEPEVPAAEQENVARFAVQGMNQNCCTKIVEYALKEVEGYLRMEADVKSQSLSVWFDPSKTDGAKIQSALNKSPYKATPVQ